MGLGPDREFRYRLGWRIGLAALGCAGLVAFPVMWAVIAWRMSMLVAALGQPAWRPAIGPGEVARLLVYGACGIAYLLGIVQSAMLGRNGWVLVTRVSIVVRDWRGRESRLYWDEVEDLRIGPYSHRAWFPGFRLHGGGKRLGVAHGVEHGDELRDLVIAQAGLTEKHTGWWYTVYRRPAAAPSSPPS